MSGALSCEKRNSLQANRPLLGRAEAGVTPVLLNGRRLNQDKAMRDDSHLLRARHTWVVSRNANPLTLVALTDPGQPTQCIATAETLAAAQNAGGGVSETWVQGPPLPLPDCVPSAESPRL